MLLDRDDADYVTAMVTSYRAVVQNLQPMLHCRIVAAGLIAAMLPLFLGLVLVLPALATPPGISTAG